MNILYVRFWYYSINVSYYSIRVKLDCAIENLWLKNDTSIPNITFKRASIFLYCTINKLKQITLFAFLQS